MRSYSELIQIPSYEGRFDYLKCPGMVGEDTFGSYRYLNQSFYTSREWLQFRNFVITRDLGCDMAYPGEEIGDIIVIHHLNPITPVDIIEHHNMVLDPENVVCVSDFTHRMIHYGKKEDFLRTVTYVERRPNDTCPWKGENKCQIL